MKVFVAYIASLGLGASFSIPWILVRMGKYKAWYLAYFAPPFIWGRAIYGWPIGLMFISLPFLHLIGLRGDVGTNVSGIIGIIGAILAGVMIVWTPDWAKPDWQQYLENKYSWQEIRGVFIPYWRQMDRETWNRLMESEEGIEELVRRARESERGERLRRRD